MGLLLESSWSDENQWWQAVTDQDNLAVTKALRNRPEPINLLPEVIIYIYCGSFWRIYTTSDHLYNIRPSVGERRGERRRKIEQM
jgi:hypothetical protein